jgi:hypothetical protein
MSDKAHQISIWFFVGVLLAVYGAIILLAGIADWSNPGNIVLGDLHVGVWWGALLLILGVIYSYIFAPNRGNR